MGGRLVRTGKEYGEIFDHHFVEFTYPSGAVVDSQCRHQPNTMQRVGEVFQDTKGTVTMSDAGTAKILNLDGKELHTISNSEGHNPYQEEHNELFAAIRNNETINNGEYGAKSTMTAILGRMATYSGRIVTWDEAIKSKLNLVPDNLSWNSNPPTMPNEDGSYPIPIPGKSLVM